MKYCACEYPLRSLNPRRKDSCNRCAKIIRPPERDPKEVIVHHCARCLCDLPPGHSGALLYHMRDGNVAESMLRFCSVCSPVITELAVSYKEPQ